MFPATLSLQALLLFFSFTNGQTTAPAACPANASASMEAALSSGMTAGGTLVSGTIYPLALWPTIYPNVTGTPTTPPLPTTAPPSTTPAPTTGPSSTTLSCSLQEEDPDQGINTQGCICGSTTLPLLTITSATAQSQSCGYTALPSSSVSNPITIETDIWTTNCQACTLVGGIADSATCTSVPACTTTAAATPTPTFTVLLSNNSVPIGNEDQSNNGTDMREAVFSKLQALCPSTATNCDSTSKAQISNIPTVVDGVVQYETLEFTIQDSYYDSANDRDKMLAAAVATWQQAASKNCQEVTYTEVENSGSGCDSTGQVKKRSLPQRSELDSRAPCENCDVDIHCPYKATICAAPDHITPVLAGTTGPYENSMNIQLSWQLEGTSAFADFLCELVGDALTAAAMEYAPELIEAEIWEQAEFEAFCGELAQGAGGD